MKKCQSFFVLKFSSSRLRDSNNKIKELTLDQARKNGEVVRISDSELLRAIRRIRGIDFKQEELDALLQLKKKRKSNYSINDEIDRMLYVPDIINVEFDDSRHYKTIISNGGIFLNGKRYERLLASAGMTRRSTVMFCDSEIIEDLRRFLNNGRDIQKPLVPAKFNAYYALASSATVRVSTPNFVVISDYEIERTLTVDFLHESESENQDPQVYPEEKTLRINLFDGQGLISPERARIWQQDLQLDYLPSAWIFRGAFLKGLLVTFDFAQLASQHNITTITDVYGKEHWIEDIDAIITTSQLKLWESYASAEEYRNICESNDFAWGISRCSPKRDKEHTFSTYQYLQNLDLNTPQQIERLCADTVKWFKNVTGDDWEYTLLFLMGDVVEKEITPAWFDNLDNPLLQSLLLEPRLISDKQIQQKVQRLIAKKIKESYLGVLLLNGNYQFMISDPLAQAEYALGLPVQGLLHSHEHYSQYWNHKQIQEICAIRSPMTWRSEARILHLCDNADTKKWYRYLDSGIVFNIYDNDAMMMSGAD